MNKQKLQRITELREAILELHTRLAIIEDVLSGDTQEIEGDASESHPPAKKRRDSGSFNPRKGGTTV